MIRNLLATTALATLIASGAYAQDTTAPAQPEVAPVEQNADQAATTETVDGHLATNIIGESVFNSTAEDAENIGEVKDIVLDAEGKVEFLVVGVGGFLGIGEKQVAVDFAQAEWAERDGDRWLVVPTTKEQLEAQAEFDPAPYEPEPAAVAVDTTAPAGTMAPSATTAPADQTAEAPADTAAPATDQPAETAEAPADTAAPAADQSTEQTAEVEVVEPAAEPAEQTAEAPADTTAPAADQTTEQTAEVEVVEPAAEPADQTAQNTAPADPAAPAVTTTQDTTQTAAIDRSTLQEMPMDQILAEDLIGTTVYGANEETVGEIGDVVLSTEGEGQIDAVLVDVGGFLGIGEKQVAIGMDKLTFMQDENENRYLYTNFTKEQLEAQPAYDEATYAEKRDEQRLIVTE